MTHRLAIAAIAEVLLAVPTFSQVDEKAPQLARAGVDGVGVPVCIYRPPKFKAQGKVVLQTTVTASGKVVNLALIKESAPGLGD